MPSKPKSRKKTLEKEINGLARQIEKHLEKIEQDKLSDPLGIAHHQKEIENFRRQIEEKLGKLRRERKSKKGRDTL